MKNRLDKEIATKNEEEKQIIKESEQIKKKIEEITLSFKVKTGKDDKVFGSISPKQIVEELKNKGFDIDKKQINIYFDNSVIICPKRGGILYNPNGFKGEIK